MTQIIIIIAMIGAAVATVAILFDPSALVWVTSGLVGMGVFFVSMSARKFEDIYEEDQRDWDQR
jgi:hypothetical protein